MTLVRRQVHNDGIRTSTSLEPEFWAYLDRIARWRNVPRSDVVAAVLAERKERRQSMSSVLRVYCLGHATQYGQVLLREAAGARPG